MSKIKRTARILSAGLILLCTVGSVVHGQPDLSGKRHFSQLWGEKGERWDPQNSRLADFTHVGYQRGDVPIPDWPVGVNVKDFGAVPDDLVDDTQAFLDAIAACPDRHAVFVPKGRYMIFRQIRIEENDHFVLRGEDMYETVLFFPKYMVETDSRESYKRTHMEGMVAFVGGTHRSIENLTLRHREQIKGGHWEFRGADGFTFNRVRDSWMRNVRITNADHSITMDKAMYISVLNVILDHSRVRPAITGSSGIFRWTGHVGIGMGGSSYNLFHRIDMRGKYFHPFDIINVPKHNVISNVRGVGGLLNNHGQGASYNLYTDLDFGLGGDFSIAAHDKGRQQSETHWGITANTNIGKIPTTTRNHHVFVGIQSDRPTTITDHFYYEAIDPRLLAPRNIYLAQMAYCGKPLPEYPLPLLSSQAPGEVLFLTPSDDVGAGKGGDNTWLPVGSYLKFDLRDLEVPRIERARLRVFTSTGLRSGPLTVGVAAVADDTWSEDTLTKETELARGEVLDSKHIEDEFRFAWMDFDITAFVREQAAGDGLISLQLPLLAGEGFVGGFNSKEHGNAPVLIIETAPSANPGPPSAPTGLKTMGGAGYIRLDWEDHPEADVRTYNVYRRTKSADIDRWGTPIAMGLVTSDHRDVSLKANRSNYDLPSDTTFYYVVTAVDSQGYESARSTPVAGTALPRK